MCGVWECVHACERDRERHTHKESQDNFMVSILPFHFYMLSKDGIEVTRPASSRWGNWFYQLNHLSGSGNVIFLHSPCVCLGLRDLIHDIALTCSPFAVITLQASELRAWVVLHIYVPPKEQCFWKRWMSSWKGGLLVNRRIEHPVDPNRPLSVC